MRFMNDYDLANAIQRYDAAETTNRLALARTVDRLRVWANQCSDGWAYWPKPARAAAKAMEQLEGNGTWADRERLEENDLTDAELRKALAPIKALLTRLDVPVQDRQYVLQDAGVAR